MQMAGGGGSFLGAAQQGMFAVDTTAGHNMVMSIRAMQDKLEEQLKRIYALKTQAKLGDLPEAREIAKLDSLVAAGDHQSLEEALLGFRDALKEARQALEIGMRACETMSRSKPRPSRASAGSATDEPPPVCCAAAAGGGGGLLSGHPG